MKQSQKDQNYSKLSEINYNEIHENHKATQSNG